MKSIRCTLIVSSLVAGLAGACSSTDPTPRQDAAMPVDGPGTGDAGETEADAPSAPDSADDRNDSNTNGSRADVPSDEPTGEDHHIVDVTGDEGRNDGDGTITWPDGRICRDSRSCPPPVSGIPARVGVSCDSPAECPLCLPGNGEPCTTMGLACDYTGTNLHFRCTCIDLRGTGSPPDAGPPDGGGALGFTCLG